jgi:hypothetical protein
MSDITIPNQDEAEIKKARRLLELREEELTVAMRLAVEKRLGELPKEVRRQAQTPHVLDPSFDDEVFEIEEAKRRARGSEVGRLKSDPERDKVLTEHLQGTGRAASPLSEERSTPGQLKDDPKRDSMLTEHLEGTGRSTTDKPAPKVKKLEATATSEDVKKQVGERATLNTKGADLGTGAATGSMKKMVGDKGVLEGLMQFFEGVDFSGNFDSEGVMKAVRLSVSLGKSEEAKEFLKVARDNMEDVKRLMANRPDDLKKLLVAGEFTALKKLVEQEVRSPSTRLIGGPSGSHQFHEHGAHNSAVQLVLLSLASGNRKSSWVSASAEQTIVEWAEQKIAAEIALLAGGDTGGPDSIGWKGAIADADQIIHDNLGYAPAQRWTGPGGVRPTSWADFVGNSEVFRNASTFRWRHPNGTVGDTANLGPVFNRNISELSEAGSAAGVGSNLAGRKIRATAVNLGAAPTEPYAHKFLDDPEITLTQGQTYFYQDGTQWKKITLNEFSEAPAITTFKAVFRKTNDAALSYKVYTAYPA